MSRFTMSAIYWPFSYQIDIGHGVRPRGYYVQRVGGLFPAPLPQDAPDTDRVVRMFNVLGVFIAKSLQDNRLVDIPLSLPFLKLLSSGGNTKTGCGNVLLSAASGSFHVSHSSMSVIDEPSCLVEDMEQCPPDTTNELDHPNEEENENAINIMETGFSKESAFIEDEELSKEENSELLKTKESEEQLEFRPSRPCWFAGLFDEVDMAVVDPHRAKFLSQLEDLVNQKNRILRDNSLSPSEKKALIQELRLKTATGVECRVEDLG